MKDIEERAKEYAYKKHDDNFGNYPDNSIADYLAGATEERKRGKRFAEWMNKNKYHWSVLFKTYNNIDEVKMWSYDDLFNQFLLEEKELNN